MATLFSGFAPTHDGPELLSDKMRIIDDLILLYDYENHDVFSDPTKLKQRASDYQLLRDTALNHYVEFTIPLVISHCIRHIQIEEHIPEDIQSLIARFWGFGAVDILSEKREAMIHFTLCENGELQEKIDELKDENHHLSLERNKLVSSIRQFSTMNCISCLFFCIRFRKRNSRK